MKQESTWEECFIIPTNKIAYETPQRTVRITALLMMTETEKF